MTEDNITAARIRERMELLRLNPFSAANKAGLKPDYVRDILRDRIKHPSADKLGKLAAALECSLFYLLGQEDPPIAIQNWRGELEPAAPTPAGSTVESLEKRAVLLPIRHELMGEVWRSASDVTRPPIGYEAASIPSAYRGRDQWFELMRDDSMDAIVPPGSLLHVVAISDDERATIGEGDLIVTVKRIVAADGTLHLVQRSLRYATERYPDLGLWFLDYRSTSPRWSNETDDILKETPSPAPSKKLPEVASMDDRVAEALGRTVEEIDQIVEEAKKYRARVVGKAIRILTPVQHDARFGVETDI